MPMPLSTSPCADHEPEDALARRAERHAHADLGRALPNGRRQHAVEPDRREHRGDDAEHARSARARIASAPSRDRRSRSSASARRSAPVGSISATTRRTSGTSRARIAGRPHGPRPAAPNPNSPVGDEHAFASRFGEREMSLVLRDADHLIHLRLGRHDAAEQLLADDRQRTSARETPSRRADRR